MFKKFVQLNSLSTPSNNPYEICTFKKDNSNGAEWIYEECKPLKTLCLPLFTANSHTANVLTDKDELQNIKANSRYRNKLKLCFQQRSPQDLKDHTVYRERYLHAKDELRKHKHDAFHRQRKPCPSLVRLNSLMQVKSEEEEETPTEEVEHNEENVELRYASPSCSCDDIFIPPKKLLELERPKSGIFHNECERHCLYFEGIDYTKYNPRLLQKQFDEQDLQLIDLINGSSTRDMWTWNLGLQRSHTSLKRDILNKQTEICDYKHLEQYLFNNPKDIDITYRSSVVYGTRAIPQSPEPRKKYSVAYCHRPQEVACLYAAYVHTFRLNPDFWTAKTLDNILKMGVKLFNKSVELNYKADDDSGFDIVKVLVEQKASVKVESDFIGEMKSESHIFNVLNHYFCKYSACMFIAHDLFLLIWKSCSNVYYVYDPNGRNHLCKRDHRGGYCSLMYVAYVEHLVNLIVHTRKLKKNESFKLYRIYLIAFDKLSDSLPETPYSKHFRKLWAVVNENYALIPSNNIGIRQPLNGKSPNASLSISLLALLYSHIETAQEWQPCVLNDLHIYGMKFNKSLLYRLGLIRRINNKKIYSQLNIHDLPEAILMGAIKALFKIQPFSANGHINPCKHYKDSLLTHALRNIFCSGLGAALLQIDNSFFSIWSDMELFYMFDPFRRNKAGQVIDPENYKINGSSCLQMHTNFDSLCRILYMKSLKLRRGGIFFLHAIRILCIRPMTKKIETTNSFSHLKLEYPLEYQDDPEFDGTMEEIEEENLTQQELKLKLKRVNRTFSIHTIPEKYLIPSFDSEDIVLTVLEKLVCDIVENIHEHSIKPHADYRQAKKVLLRSDKDYIKMLMIKLKHGEDIDNIVETHKMVPDTQSPNISLEEELLLPSNFQKLPDGSWVIFGRIDLPLVDEEVVKLSAILSCLTALCLSAKYNIATWGPEVVDFAVQSVNNFGEQYTTSLSALSAIFEKKLPDISIGDNCYCFIIEKIIRSGVMHSLRKVLLECLSHYNRFLVVCPRFTCVIFRRYNFVYMFVAYACNQVGYRHFKVGPACVLRFVELDSLIRRIEFGCDPNGCEINNYVVILVKIKDITNGVNKVHFRHWREKEEDLLCDYASKQHQILLKKINQKMDFLNTELAKEHKRINLFNAEKTAHQQKKNLSKTKCFKKNKDHTITPPLIEHNYKESELEDYEEDEVLDLKHKPGTILARENIGNHQPQTIIYGYRRRSRDGLFKIQGDRALNGRDVYYKNEIKACFFVSSIAVITSVLKPLHEWTAHYVNHAIDKGNYLASRMTRSKLVNSRLLKNINIDDYTFDVKVQDLDKSKLTGLTTKEKLEKLANLHHHFLLQLENCTYSIYHDELYHLFDPYPSMEMINPVEEEEDDALERMRSVKEQNTASWVLFANINGMLEYIDKRTNYNWKNEIKSYQLHSLVIVNYRKSKKTLRILRAITNGLTCKVPKDISDESSVCVQFETMSWLENENTLPIWSRLILKNDSGKYRNLPITKHNKFDIEIDKRLWSLWGNLHPMAPCFDIKSRGKQYLACNVVSCCAAKLYRLANWSPQLLDNIIISGDIYHQESLNHIKIPDYEFSLEDLNLNCKLENLNFAVHLEHVAFGRLYCLPSATNMNLSEGLMYFFTNFQFGILQVHSRSLAIGYIPGYNGGYFMFDCQSHEHPLFPRGQGAAYLLRTRHLQILLYCIVITLRISYYNVKYTLHKVEVLPDGAQLDEEDIE